MNPIGRMFAHDAWANREALCAIGSAGDVVRARKLMAHIVGAECLWLSRLGRDGGRVPVWPDWDLDECESRLQWVSAAWREYFDSLAQPEAAAPQDLGAIVAYVNSKGERWENSVGDILLHVPLHSSYHRGQIAMVLRDSGTEPAYTDYIECVRRGCLEE